MKTQQTIGIKDIPVRTSDDDRLGLEPYIKSLSEFLTQCDTPVTISIQGDWGTGKTSLMNMVKQNISDRVIPVWFNTWQFSQFEMQNMLPISMIMNFINEIDGDNKSGIKEDVLAFTRGLVKVGLMMASNHLLGDSTSLKGSFQTSNESSSDLSADIMKLKKTLQTAVNTVIKNTSNKNKIVVFVDDLDRLNPEKAVELLEVMKLFLDIEHCVFVLAVDYDVVVKGVKKKYGDDMTEEKGRSFFDKIIQLPFCLPVSQYKTKEYIQELLHKINIKPDDTSLGHYQKLVEASVGTNPRALKRLFNLFLLVTISASHHPDLSSIADKDLKEKIIFATLCLQTSFDEAYTFLQNTKLQVGLLEKVAEIDQYKDAQDLRGLIKRYEKYGENIDEKLDLLSNFIKNLICALDTDKSDKIEKNELDFFSKILTFSSITSIDENKNINAFDKELREKNKKEMTKLAYELNKKYQNGKSGKGIENKSLFPESRFRAGVMSSDSNGTYATLRITHENFDYFLSCVYGNSESYICIEPNVKDTDMKNFSKYLRIFDNLEELTEYTDMIRLKTMNIDTYHGAEEYIQSIKDNYELYIKKILTKMGRAI